MPGPIHITELRAALRDRGTGVDGVQIRGFPCALDDLERWVKACADGEKIVALDIQERRVRGIKVEAPNGYQFWVH